jgi:hypothetical protein
MKTCDHMFLSQCIDLSGPYCLSYYIVTISHNCIKFLSLDCSEKWIYYGGLSCTKFEKQFFLHRGYMTLHLCISSQMKCITWITSMIYVALAVKRTMQTTDIWDNAETIHSTIQSLLSVCNTVSTRVVISNSTSCNRFSIVCIFFSCIMLVLHITLMIWSQVFIKSVHWSTMHGNWGHSHIFSP